MLGFSYSPQRNAPRTFYTTGPPVKSRNMKFIVGHDIIPFVPQSCTVRIAVTTRDVSTRLASTQDTAYFNLTGSMKDFGFKGNLANIGAWSFSPIVLPCERHLPDVRIRLVDGFSRKAEAVWILKSLLQLSPLNIPPFEI